MIAVVAVVLCLVLVTVPLVMVAVRKRRLRKLIDMRSRITEQFQGMLEGARQQKIEALKKRGVEVDEIVQLMESYGKPITLVEDGKEWVAMAQDGKQSRAPSALEAVKGIVGERMWN